MIRKCIMGWRRNEDNIVLDQPHIEFEGSIDPGEYTRYTSTHLMVDGYWVLRVTEHNFLVAPDGQRQKLSTHTYDEFFIHHPGLGWEPIGVGRDGRIDDWFDGKFEKRPGQGP